MTHLIFKIFGIRENNIDSLLIVIPHIISKPCFNQRWCDNITKLRNFPIKNTKSIMGMSNLSLNQNGEDISHFSYFPIQNLVRGEENFIEKEREGVRG